MTESRLRAVIGLLSLAGMAVAAYLTVTRYSGSEPYCLAGSSGCKEVQDSEYAELLGVPVAVLGLASYAVLFATALLPGRTAAAAGAAIAISGTAFSAWLLYAQVALIDAVCQWCVASDVIMALLAVATVLRLRQST